MRIFLKILTSFLLLFHAVNNVYSWDTPRNATPGQFPYLVSIYWHNIPLSPPRHVCGGVILNAFWILTSGYCEIRVQIGVVVVKVGSHDIAADDDNVQTVEISQKITNHKYPGLEQIVNLGPNDLSLFKMATPLQFNNRVQPAKLPKKDSLLRGQRLNYNMIVAGWGSPTHIIIPNHSTILQTVQLPIIENRICQNAIRIIFNNFNLKDSQMCTRPINGNIAACIGDYGGPLIQMNRRNEPLIIAIRSYSTANCNTNNLPPVYTRVSPFVSWIKKTMKTNS